MAVITHKVCVRCKIEHLIDFFDRNKPNKDGRHSYCKDCRKELDRIRYEKDPEKRKLQARKGRIKYLYGMTWNEYIQFLEDHSYKCDICELEASDRNFKPHCVDHDHETGKVRGLLCTECNFALGHFKDKKELLMKAYKYLETFEGGGLA